MKKNLVTSLMTVVLVIGLFVLTGCGSKKGKEVTLKYSNDNTTNTAVFKLSEDDKVTKYDENSPESARVENEKQNYVLDLYIEALSKDAYNQDQQDAKKDYSGYTETKFGKYSGYTAEVDDDIEGIILLDTTDENSYKKVTFALYLNDESKENSDLHKIYSSSSIQDILNNITYKTEKK